MRESLLERCWSLSGMASFPSTARHFIKHFIIIIASWSKVKKLLPPQIWNFFSEKLWKIIRKTSTPENPVPRDPITTSNCVFYELKYWFSLISMWIYIPISILHVYTYTLTCTPYSINYIQCWLLSDCVIIPMSLGERRNEKAKKHSDIQRTFNRGLIQKAFDFNCQFFPVMS